MKKGILSFIVCGLVSSMMASTPVMADSYQMYVTKIKTGDLAGTLNYHYRKPDMSNKVNKSTLEYVGIVKFSSMYRLYNPNSGEHFYTASANEKDFLVKSGWKDEGISWYAPEKSNHPVYRLYNPNAGDHHYTTSSNEKDYLVKVGWNYEGIGWYGVDRGDYPIYRQYNPNAKTGTHNYTGNTNEKDALVNAGWRDEGIAFEEDQLNTSYAERYGGKSDKQQSNNSDITNNHSNDIKETNDNNDNVSGYGTLTGVCMGYKAPDVGSYILLVPKDGRAYDYDYIYGTTIPSADSEKYHIYSARVNALGTYTINHVAAGEYKMIYYSQYYDLTEMLSLGAFTDEIQETRKNDITNEFSPYINSNAVKNIAWIYNASNIHDVIIYPNEITSQDG